MLAAMVDDIRNTEQTEFDVVAQVAGVIKYVPITDKKTKEIKQITVSDTTMPIIKKLHHSWLARNN